MATEFKPQRVESPAAWRGSEISQRSDWEHVLTTAQVAEVDAALQEVNRRGLAMEDITPGDFVLPELGSRLAQAQHDLENGTGAFFLRGWPVESYSVEDNTRAYWGMACHLGTPVSQSAKGEKVFSVRNAGFKKGDPRARGPNTSNKLHFHCDRCDVLGFLCINRAKEGGESLLVSSITVHNEILERRPDLLEQLYQPWYYKTHNVDLANPEPWCRQPIFAIQDDRFVGYVLRVLIDRAYELPELPDMTPLQREALDFLDDVCAEPDLNYRFYQEAGDILFVNNFVAFHSRTAFEDHEEEERKRLIQRIWLAVPNSRALPPSFAGAFGATAAGAIRGGIHKVG